VNLVLIIKELLDFPGRYSPILCRFDPATIGLSNPNTLLNHTAAIHSAMSPASLEAQFYHEQYKAVRIPCGQKLAIYLHFARHKAFSTVADCAQLERHASNFCIIRVFREPLDARPFSCLLAVATTDSERLP
jgi:hypothetical protein